MSVAASITVLLGLYLKSEFVYHSTEMRVYMFCRYIAHMLEKACQFDESELAEAELQLESAVNIQSTRTTAIAADVAAVKTEVAELSMTVAEEMDGRLNVE
jgi:hypothetical protein